MSTWRKVLGRLAGGYGPLNPRTIRKAVVWIEEGKAVKVWRPEETPTFKQLAGKRYLAELMARYAEWQEERVDLEMRDGFSGEDHPSHSEWQRSDDEAVKILTDMARYMKHHDAE